MTSPASWFRKDRRISAITAWICLFINQLVTPGLGTLISGRLWFGLVELVIAFVGFGFVMAWFYNLFKAVVTTEDLDIGLQPHAWLGILGLLLFGLAWCLSLVSSIRIVHQATRMETRRPPPLAR